jgi:hypothetical protein
MTQSRDFIKMDLGPALKAAHPNTLLMMGDDQRRALFDFASAFLILLCRFLSTLQRR